MSVPLANMTVHTAVTMNHHHKSFLALVQRDTNFVMIIDRARISTSECHNEDGTFSCRCNPGFEPNYDGTECVGKLSCMLTDYFKPI